MSRKPVLIRRIPRSLAWPPLAFVLVIGVVSYFNTKKLIANSHADARSHGALQMLEGTLSTAENADLGQRRYLITGEESYLSPYRTAVSRLPEQLRYLRETTADNAAQQTRLDSLERLITKSLDSSKAEIALRTNEGFEGVRHLIFASRVKNEIDEIRLLIEEMENEENKALTRRAEESQASTHDTILLLALESARMKSSRCSAPAAWARSIARATRN